MHNKNVMSHAKNPVLGQTYAKLQFAPYIGVMGQFKFLVLNLTHVPMNGFSTLNILLKKYLGSFVFGAN